MLEPKDIIQHYNLEAHPEGGWFKETWRDDSQPRAVGTAIYFLLEAHQSSHWHKVDADEIWHHYDGAPMELHIHHSGKTEIHILGKDIKSGQAPQLRVPKDAWQKSVPIDGWVFVGCTVSPGFEFDHFELAPDGWSPQ